MCGLGLAFAAKGALSAQMRELYGTSENGGLAILAAFAGAALTEGILLLAVRRTLKRTEKLSAIEALTGQPGGSKQRHFPAPQYLVVALVIALGMCLMILPQNLLSTISSPKFVTYMGIGDGEIRLDLRQTENIGGKTEQVETLLAQEETVDRFAVLQTLSCRAVLPDGSYTALQVEQGDHTVFPVTYAKGEAPKAKNEIALSYLCAEELGLSLGDTLLLLTEEAPQEYTVCGIYSDITNGGKTAKAASLPGGGAPMWSVVYVSLKEGTPKEQWLSAWTRILSDRGISAKAVDIQEYVTETYHKPSRLIAYGGDHVLRKVSEERQTHILREFMLHKQNYALSICRIEPENNCHVTLKAFAENGKPLIFIGNWNSSLYGKELRKRYGHMRNIIMMDSVYDMDSLYTLRKNCSIYIHGHSAGGTNPSLVEAMFFGCPILAYDVQYNRETTFNAAYYYKSATELNALCQAEHLDGSRMLTPAHSHYSWETITRRYENLYYGMT